MSARFAAVSFLLFAWAAEAANDGSVYYAPMRLDGLSPAVAVADLEAKVQREGGGRVIVRFAPDALRSAVESGAATTDAVSGEGLVERSTAAALREMAASLSATLGPHATIERRFSGLPLVAMRVDAAGFARLRESPLVVQVEEDRLVRPMLAESMQRIGADAAHLDGDVGDGQLVAVLDSGVLETHDYLAGRVRTDLEACFSTPAWFGDVSLCPDGSNGGPECLDSEGRHVPGSVCGPGAASVQTCLEGGASYCSHGTHVSAVAAGATGVAPGAGLIPIQVFFRRGRDLYSYTSDLIAALDYVLGLKKSGVPVAAVNLSLGSGTYTSVAECELGTSVGAGGMTSGIKDVIDALRGQGTATVVAAGNSGSIRALSYPGCLSNVISVGATYDTVDRVWEWSNQHSAMTMFAPGHDITSASSDAPSATVTYSGTSVATPHVSGAVAVLAAAVEGTEHGVANLVAAMQLGGEVFEHRGFRRPYGNVYGVPRLQLDRALSRLLDAGGLPFRLIVDSHLGGVGEPGSSFVAQSGAFQSLGLSGAYGGDTWRGVSHIEPNAARFVASLPPGIYEVEVRWPEFDGNPTWVTVTISHDYGDTTLVVDQTRRGDDWVALGRYAFETVAEPAVTLSDEGRGGLMADAVRFTTPRPFPLGGTPLGLEPTVEFPAGD